MTITTGNVPALNSENSLTQYLKEAWKYPVLKAEEERELAERWRDHATWKLPIPW